MLVDVVLPAQTMIFYSHIFEIAKFDIFEHVFKCDVLLDKIFNLDDVAVSQRIADLGYESHFIITNLGPVFIGIVVILLLQLIIYITFKCECLQVNHNALAKRLHNKFWWNGAISFYDNVHLIMCFSVVFNLHSSDTDNWGSLSMKINTVTAIIAGISVVLVPLLLSIFLCKYWYPHVSKINEVR